MQSNIGSNRRGCRAVEVIVHSEEEATFVSILVAVSPRCADGLLGGVVEPVALKAAHAKGRAGHPVLSLLSRRSRT